MKLSVLGVPGKLHLGTMRDCVSGVDSLIFTWMADRLPQQRMLSHTVQTAQEHIEVIDKRV